MDLSQICLTLPLEHEDVSKILKPRIIILAWLTISAIWNSYVYFKVEPSHPADRFSVAI